MTSLTDSLMQEKILIAKEKTLTFFKSLQSINFHEHILKTSKVHDEKIFPQMLLSGTYDSLMCKQILGINFNEDNKTNVGDWLLSHQTPEGFFEFKNTDWSTFYKKPNLDETKSYVRFHITNYCLGALEALGRSNSFTLPFVTPYLDRTNFWAWLGQRDMRDPWLEGNNIVNMASFLIHEGSEQAKARLNDMIEWHIYQSEPYSGFWGPGQQYSPLALLFSLCGATHNFHLFFHENVDIPHFNQSISRCLEQPIALRSSCIDVDVIDILSNAYVISSERRDEIAHWLYKMLVLLLNYQNEDGGFPDTLLGSRGFDGWVKGYQEPQGISNTFATWFRWIAIAMIADVLWPHWQPWQFRKNIGVGYFKNYK